MDDVIRDSAIAKALIELLMARPPTGEAMYVILCELYEVGWEAGHENADASAMYAANDGYDA